MLEALVSRPGIQKVGKCKLRYVPKTLERARIQHLSLMGIVVDENVNRVTDFVENLRRC